MITDGAAERLIETGRTSRPEKDGGFVLVFFALAIIALMGIAALVVDVGYWYLRGDQIQRAADAAALAGVVYMPGNAPLGSASNAATNEADSVLASNGFNPSDGNLTVSVTGTSDPHQLKVSVTDNSVSTFFGKVFGLDKITETRTSTAEYQPPVPLGSAENSFGTGNLALGAGNPTGLWAAVNGYCTSKENGDEFLSGYDATYNGSTWACPANGPSTPTTVANYEYNGNDGATAGYSYEIVTPTDPGGDLTQALSVDGYDPAYEPSGCAGTPDLPLGTGSAITTVYTLTYEPDPLDPSQDTQVSGLTVGTTSGGGGLANQYVATSGAMATCAQWANLFVIPSGSPDGTYRLQVTTPQSPGQNSDGSNAYGLRVYEGTTFQRCSTNNAVAWYSASCPVIQGENALSVYANESGGSGNFYLAKIDASYANHVLEVSLFDPGEGDKDIELVEPDGSLATFLWETTDSCPGTVFGPPFAGAPDCAEDLGFQHLPAGPPGTLDFTDSLNVDQTVPAPVTGQESQSLFNDRRVVLAFAIPPGYTAPDGGWWQIHYDSTGKVTDRTTWTVSLSGSPIHLVQP